MDIGDTYIQIGDSSDNTMRLVPNFFHTATQITLDEFIVESKFKTEPPVQFPLVKKLIDVGAGTKLYLCNT